MGSDKTHRVKLQWACLPSHKRCSAAKAGTIACNPFRTSKNDGRPWAKRKVQTRKRPASAATGMVFGATRGALGGLSRGGNCWAKPIPRGFVRSKKFTNRKIIHARGSTRIPKIHIVQSLRAEAGMAHGLQRCRKTTNPNGIATYSQVGGGFGDGSLWTAFSTLPLMGNRGVYHVRNAGQHRSRAAPALLRTQR